MKDWKSIALFLGAIVAFLLYRHFNVIEPVSLADEAENTGAGSSRQPADPTVIVADEAGGTGRNNATGNTQNDPANILIDQTIVSVGATR